MVTLTYETEAEAQEAHDLMAKVIAGAALTPHPASLNFAPHR